MNDISNIYSKIGAYDAPYNKKTNEPNDVDKSVSKGGSNRSNISGKTIGNPKLSDEAAKYYDELKKKYHNMEFILVSKDQKENAKAQAASYAKANKMVVLVDDEKIERMASDKTYREQYESIIENAANGFKQVSNSIASTGANVKGFGMQVNDDGTASYFAVLKESSKAQSERISAKRAEKAAQKKAEDKKAQKEKNEERLEAKRTENRKEKAESVENQLNSKLGSGENDITISANSIEELILKIQDHMQMTRSNEVLSESELNIGGNIDFTA